MLEVTFTGMDAQKRRMYAVRNGASENVAVVTAINEDEWEYECSLCQGECEHVGAVCEARNEFEAADHQMGDATP